MVKILNNYKKTNVESEEFLKAGGRYTRFVVWMRITLPVIAGIIILLIFAWPQMKENPKDLQLGLSEKTVPDSGKQEIINPRFTGIDKQNRPYTITAKTAFPRQNQPKLISLSFPHADITTKTGAWITLSANKGVFNRLNEVLQLSGSVNLFHDNGHNIKTPKAKIFLREGIAVSDNIVKGQGPIGFIKSKGFLISKTGQNLIFTGSSKLVLHSIKRKGKI